ncbi:MAG TPA: Asp-tRNA(Asn)/Glu-tRNA(Gln) amidotransferase subunit GatC [Candidatus Thermoplasmatota archaeon]|nr:Asp-tRNA(Asn)/Glu-tRNA(Gln) amidotransferase subunit GatC [Candidatus Thermoplasmatota archaeon]
MASPPVPVEHVARIARLALTPPELERFAAEAAAILGHFQEVEAALQAPDVAGPGALLEPRADEARAPDAAQVEAIVAQFPRRADRLCKVPEGL